MNLYFPDIFSQDEDIFVKFQKKWQERLILLNAKYRVLLAKLDKIFPAEIRKIIISYFDEYREFEVFKTMKVSPDLEPKIIKLIEQPSYEADNSNTEDLNSINQTM